MICGVWILGTVERQRVSTNESFSQSPLSEWAQAMGTWGREVNKAKQTLHLCGIANHHADTYCVSHRIKVGTTGISSGAANAKTSWKCFAIPLPRIRNSISSDSYSQKCCSKTKNVFWANKAETLCAGKHPSAGGAWFIGDNLWDLSPCFMSLSWGQIISAHREKYQERQRWETKRGGEKEKWLWRGGITARILSITIIHISHCDV